MPMEPVPPRYDGGAFLAYSQDRDDPSKSALHDHACHEMILVEGGACEFDIEGRKYAVRAGSLVVIGWLETHRVRVLETPYRRHVLLIPNRFFMEEMRAPQLASLFLCRQASFSHVLRPDAALFARTRALMEDIVAEYAREAPLKSVRMALLVELLLIDLYRGMPDCFAWENSADTALVFEMQRFISAHASEPVTLDTLSRRFGVSRYHISRRFPSVTGMRFSAYLTACRMNAAKRLLLGTDWSVTRVAEAAGYGDVSHFIRAFRQRVGVPPHRFRKNGGAGGLEALDSVRDSH